MNSTFINNSQILQELNDVEFVSRMPAFIILVFLMLSGAIGNGLVIYVYGCHRRKTTVQYFVTLLAIFDFLSCAVEVPLCLIILRLPLLYPNETLCKFTGLLGYFTTLASVITLLIISVERYKKICHPTMTVLSIKHSRYVAIIISLLAALIGTPSFIIYKKVSIIIPDTNLLGYECTQDPENEFKPYYWGFLFIITIITILAMLLLYGLIWRRLRRYYLHVKTTHISNVRINDMNILCESARRKIIETTKITFIVTFLFIVSFLPLTIYQVVLRFFSSNSMSFGETIFYHVSLNLWALNSALNPFVYGFYSQNFRRELGKLFQVQKNPFPSRR